MSLKEWILRKVTTSSEGFERNLFSVFKKLQGTSLTVHWASLVTQMVKNLPAMQETWVRSLGWEDPLEKGMATHSSIFAWRIPWTEEPGRLQSTSCKELDTTE